MEIFNTLFQAIRAFREKAALQFLFQQIGSSLAPKHTQASSYWNILPKTMERSCAISEVYRAEAARQATQSFWGL